MKDEYKSYMQQVQKSATELKPRHLRQRNGAADQVTPGIGKNPQANNDNAFILDNLGVYEPPNEARGKQRYENSFHAYSRGSSRAGLQNNPQSIAP